MMPVGEYIIILQDVGVISGLLLDWDAAVDNSVTNWMSYCQKFFYHIPPANIMRGSFLLLS